MLIEFNVTNYLSIRDQITLSMVKAKGKELEATNIINTDHVPGTPTLLKGAAIYGANAAGKSNLIKALMTMQKIVTKSASQFQPEDHLPLTPYLFDETSQKQPTEFEVTFINEGVRYQYGFSATQERIIEEWLLAYPKGSPQTWIERIYDPRQQETVWGKMDKLAGQKKIWQQATRPNALFLSTAMQLNNDQLKPVFNWFSKVLRIASIGGWNNNYSVELCDKKESKNNILNFLKAADIGIEDIVLEKQKFSLDNLPNTIPMLLKGQLEKDYKDKPLINVKTLHKTADGKIVALDLSNESDGTQKLFAFAGPWLNALENGYVLVIDELHDNLHPLMVKFLVSLFQNAETNPKNAQLVFTTHDTSILDQNIFRRDQIWFCEKDKTDATGLYPLTDFSPRKGVENLERGYLAGRYGALPYLKPINLAIAQ